MRALAIAVEPPDLKLDDILEEKTSRLKDVRPVIETTSYLVIGVGIKPTFNGTKTGEELRKVIHDTP